jgi:hypothetical protein
MFLNLAQAIFTGANPPPPAVQVMSAVQAMNVVLTNLTAEQLAYYADRVWEQPRVGFRNVLPGGNLVQHQQQSYDIRGPIAGGAQPLPPAIGYWRHIVYAYMLECTNMGCMVSGCRSRVRRRRCGCGRPSSSSLRHRSRRRFAR